MSKKNLALIIVAIILIVIGLIILNDKDEGNSNTGNENTVVEDPIVTKKTNGTYEIFNTSIDTSTGATKIKAAIKNVSGSATPEQTVQIVLLDKDKNELGTISATVPSLENGGVATISSKSLKVYENIYDFKVK